MSPWPTAWTAVGRLLIRRLQVRVLPGARRRGAEHSPLTACLGPRRAGHGRWRVRDAPSARAASLASSAALPGPPDDGLTRPTSGATTPMATSTSIPTAFPAPPMAYPTHPACRHLRWPCSLGGLERPGRKERFGRLIQRPVRVLGGPAVRAACGGDLKPDLVATQGGRARTGLGVFLVRWAASEPQAKQAVVIQGRGGAAGSPRLRPGRRRIDPDRPPLRTPGRPTRQEGGNQACDPPCA